MRRKVTKGNTLQLPKLNLQEEDGPQTSRELLVVCPQCGSRTTLVGTQETSDSEQTSEYCSRETGYPRKVTLIFECWDNKDHQLAVHFKNGMSYRWDALCSITTTSVTEADANKAALTALGTMPEHEPDLN